MFDHRIYGVATQRKIPWKTWGREGRRRGRGEGGKHLREKLGGTYYVGDNSHIYSAQVNK